MRYFVVSDTHGFYDETIGALTSMGFFTYPHKKKLVICGDLMDRGTQSVELQKFVLDLYHKDELIFVRGNHEDLMMDMLINYAKHEKALLFGESHHNSNGTFDTALQLSEFTNRQAYYDNAAFLCKVFNSPFVSILIPTSYNYFETKNYIFVHGWIPADNTNNSLYGSNWRNAPKEDWEKARWTNGIDAALFHRMVEPNKTIVCGHWNCSYGHKYLNKTCATEFDRINSNFNPFYAPGIIAIDACTAISGKVNCIVIDD